MYNRPVQKKAIEYLIHLVQQCRKEGKKRLPTIHEMANSAGISRAVIGKAVAIFRNEGILMVRQGKGIIITDAGNTYCTTPEEGPASTVLQKDRPIPKWYTVANQLEKDISTGTYPPNVPLPTHKELSFTYNVCYKTLQKALTFLIRKKLLLLNHNKYIPLPFELKNPRAALLIIFRTEYGVMQMYVENHVRKIIEVCDAAGCSVKAIPYNYPDDKHVSPDAHYVSGVNLSDVDIDDSLGAIMCLTGMLETDYKRIITRIQMRNRPVAILDESNSFSKTGFETSSTHSTSKNPLLRRFIIGYSSRIGHDMGRFLLSLGHRKMVYISPCHNTIWSQNRFFGLRDVIKSGRFGGELTEVVPADRDIGASNYISREEQQSVMKSVLTLCRSQNNNYIMTYGQAIRDSNFSIARNLSKRRNYVLARLLFERALDHEATVWICANDEIALAALHFLKEKGIAVPGKVSVVGFDDTVDAHLMGLTSYNFNTSGLIKAMVNYILRPNDFVPSGNQNDPFEIEGFIVGRKTTAVVS